MGLGQSKKNQQQAIPQTQHTPLREERSQSLRATATSSSPIPVKRQSSTPVVSLTMRRKTSLFTAKSASPPPTRVQSATKKSTSPIVSAAPEYKNEDDLIIGTPPKRRNRSFSMPYKVVPLNVSSEESMWRELRNANAGQLPSRCQSAHSMPQSPVSPVTPVSPASPEGRLLRRLSKAHKSEMDLPSILVTPPKDISNLEHLSPSQRKKCLTKSPTVLSSLKTPYIIETGENLPKSPIFAKGVLINA